MREILRDYMCQTFKSLGSIAHTCVGVTLPGINTQALRSGSLTPAGLTGGQKAGAKINTKFNIAAWSHEPEYQRQEGDMSKPGGLRETYRQFQQGRLPNWIHWVRNSSHRSCIRLKRRGSIGDHTAMPEFHFLDRAEIDPHAIPNARLEIRQGSTMLGNKARAIILPSGIQLSH